MAAPYPQTPNLIASRGFCEQSSWIGDKFHQDGAPPGAVEFAKKDSLPGAKRELSVFNEDGLAGAGENRFHVRVRVALSMLVGTFMRDEPIEKALDIGGDIRIGMFVNRNACRGVRNVDVADRALKARIANGLLHLARDIHELRAACCLDAKRLHAQEAFTGWE